jgi:hypothetical protein
MTVFINIDGEEIMIRARAESEDEDGGIIGDAVWIIRPGQTFMGKPHAYWKALGNGAHTVPTDEPDQAEGKRS